MEKRAGDGDAAAVRLLAPDGLLTTVTLGGEQVCRCAGAHVCGCAGSSPWRCTLLTTVRLGGVQVFGKSG